MELIEILLIVFMIASIIVLAASYYPVMKGTRRNKSNIGDEISENVVDRVQQNLAVLKGRSDPAVKAAAFVGLMDLSYVLVHVMVNKGNNYDDKLQSERFRKSLTPEVMERLTAVEGRYE